MCPEVNLICLRCHRRDHIRLPCANVYGDHHDRYDACKRDADPIGHPIISVTNRARQTMMFDILEHDILVE